MKRETYKGRKIKVVAGRGADWGYTRVTLNGVDMGKSMGNEEGALTSTRSYIDHADEVGVSSARYGAEWYAPGTFELCDGGHAKKTGGECGHSWCVEQRAKVAPVDAEIVEYRETALRVVGVERTVRTEMGGKIRTVKQLETAHTKAVKDSITALRVQRIEAAHAGPIAEDEALERRRWIKFHLMGRQGPLTQSETEKLESSVRYSIDDRKRHADETMEKLRKGAVPKNVPYTDLKASLRPATVRYTDPTTYLVEIEPGHYATAEVAETLALF